MIDKKQEKYCLCDNSTNKIIIKADNYSFCQQCGSILLKGEDNKIYHTMKKKQKIKPTEFDPIELIKTMKKKTEFEYPHINKEYNISEKENYDQEKLLNSINLYLKYRKTIILTLQKMMKMLDYSDLIFYQCLFYMDSYLSHNMTEEMSEKTILYYLVGYFLCSAKLKETDIYEPSLDSFCCIKKKVYLSMEKMLYYEVVCLKTIKYNIFSYSVYDWMCELITNGFVFNCEINKNNSIVLVNGHRHSIINTISKYAMKILLNITVKDLFIKYSPMYIAFSLLQIAREKYLDKSIINVKLFNQLINIYGVDSDDFQKCYKEIKDELEDKHNEKNGESKEKKEENHELEEIKKIANDDTLITNVQGKMDKKVVVTTKMKSSNTIVSLRDVLKKQKENVKEIEKKEEENIVEKEKEKDNNKEEDVHNISNEFSKDDSQEGENIIIFEEKKEEKNDFSEQKKLILNDEEPKEENDTKNKQKNSLDIANIKIQNKNKNKLIINCNNSSYKSNDNLPKVNIFDSGLNDENNRRNIKHSSTNETNKFLKSHKNLNPIKSKLGTNTIDNKRYFQSNFSNNNAVKPKEDLNAMRKSLFGENPNNNKSLNAKEAVGMINRNINKMNSMKVITRLSKLQNIIKEDIKPNNNKEEEIKNNNINDNKKREKCKSKGKSKNNLAGKEIKINVALKRNQSTNNDFKRKSYTYKNSLNVNNSNNMKWKNN